MQGNKENNIIGFRGTYTGKDKKGRDVLTVYMSQDDLQKVVADLQNQLAGGKGARMSFHTGVEFNEKQGKQVTRTFAYIQSGEASNNAQKPTGRFVPARNGSTLNSRVE